MFIKSPLKYYLDCHPGLLKLEVELIDVGLLVLWDVAGGGDLDEAHVHQPVLVLGRVQLEGEGVSLSASQGELARHPLEVSTVHPRVEGAPEGGTAVDELGAAGCQASARFTGL